MRGALHMLAVIVLGLIVLALWAANPGVETTVLMKTLACLDAALALGLLARMESY